MSSFLIAVVLWQASFQKNGASVDEISGAIRAHEFSKAIVLTDTALKSSPEDPRLWTLRGIAEEGTGDHVKALEAFKRALRSAPNYLAALKGTAQIEYNTGSANAEQTLQKILKQQPADEVSHAMLGALAFKQKDFAAARQHYQVSADVISRKPEALTEYAQCLLEAHQNRQAIDVLRQAAQLKTDDWTSQYNVALAEFETNDALAALADLRPLLSGEHPPSMVLELASAAFEANGDTPSAVATIRRAIVDQPAQQEFYLHFVDLCFVHRSFQAGIDMVTAGLQQMPASAPLYVARGILWTQLAKYDRADADFRKADEIDPSQDFSSLAEGVADLQTANFDDAIAKTEAQIRKTPNDAFLYYLKAEAINRKGLEDNAPELHKAIDAATKAVQLRPNFPLAEDLLGSLYRKQGREELARQQFENALKHDPANESVLYHLILMERKAGHMERVRELLAQLGEAKQKAQQEAVKASKYRLVVPEHAP